LSIRGKDVILSISNGFVKCGFCIIKNSSA
jgi:hypothetical protein